MSDIDDLNLRVEQLESTVVCLMMRMGISEADAVEIRIEAEAAVDAIRMADGNVDMAIRTTRAMMEKGGANEH